MSGGRDAALRIEHAGIERRAEIEAVHGDAFGGRVEGQLATALLLDPTATPLVSLLALIGSDPVGHVLFTHALVRRGAQTAAAALLCPLGVVPTAQRQGVGSALVRAGLDQLQSGGVPTQFVFGDPAYYGRFGFVSAQEASVEPPHPIPKEWRHAFMIRAGREHAGAPAGVLSCAARLDDPDLWIV
ncbi:MAG: N-acetyltransferase [Pseudomonadota bacterium]